MPVDDDFLPRLGHLGRDRSFAGMVRRAANLARGGAAQLGGRSRFTGARIGRDAGVGRVLGHGDRFAHARARRVVVKTHITRLAGKGVARVAAHLRYLERDGTTRTGERGTLYGPESFSRQSRWLGWVESGLSAFQRQAYLSGRLFMRLAMSAVRFKCRRPSMRKKTH